MLRQVGELEAKLRDLERLGETEHCPTCNQPMSNAHPDDLEKKKSRGQGRPGTATNLTRDE